MSDKYYLHDCNSYTHCHQNTYRIECRDIKHREETVTQQVTAEAPPRKWWQRLWQSDLQHATR